MTNQEILEQEILLNKLMTKEELESYIEENFSLPLYLTYAEWNKRGYKIQKGQKVAIKTKLWMRTKRKIDKTKELDDENTQEGFVLVSASLFGPEQVEKVEVK
jgi:hypothetical protein